MSNEIELLFIQKSFDVFNDQKQKTGVVLMFENVLFNVIDENNNKIPDYIIVLINNNKIQHITSKHLNVEDIKKYLLDKYKIEELLEI